MAAILLVDHDSNLRNLLSHVGHRVTCAASAEDAEAAIGNAPPDLLVVDLEASLALMRRLRADKRTREVAVMVLSDRSDEQDKVLALEAGADDYLTKPISPPELLARIDAVLRRGPLKRLKGVIEIAGLRIDPAWRHASAGERTIELGAAEFRLLHFLMTHPGRTYTRGQLVDHIWGDDDSIEPRSVDVHITRLRRALAPTGHDRLIRTVRGAGYMFRA